MQVNVQVEAECSIANRIILMDWNQLGREGSVEVQNHALRKRFLE